MTRRSGVERSVDVQRSKLELKRGVVDDAWSQAVLEVDERCIAVTVMQAQRQDHEHGVLPEVGRTYLRLPMLLRGIICLLPRSHILVPPMLKKPGPKPLSQGRRKSYRVPNTSIPGARLLTSHRGEA